MTREHEGGRVKVRNKGITKSRKSFILRILKLSFQYTAHDGVRDNLPYWSRVGFWSRVG